MLRCTRGHFVLASTCKGPGACKTFQNVKDDTTSVSCDENIADVGDPCDPAEQACNSDGKTLLGCDTGKFRIAKSCAGGCVAAGSGSGYECRGRPAT